MSEQNTPSVYTVPDSDGDDVLGHILARDEAPGIHKSATDDDVEGHRKADAAPGVLARDRVKHNDDDDVEGHRKADAAPGVLARDRVKHNDDDVEGHRKA